MFDIKKFLNGFNPLNGANWGKILYYVIIVSTVILIYHNAFKPKTLQTITTQVVNNCPEEKGVGMSVHLWKLRLSLGL